MEIHAVGNTVYASSRKTGRSENVFFEFV